MSTELAALQHRVEQALDGASSAALGVVAALPADCRIEVVRLVLAARPRREAHDLPLTATGRRRFLTCEVLTQVVAAWDAHAARGERGLRAVVDGLLAELGWWSRRQWLAVRTLVRMGLIRAPEHGNYVKGMFALGGAWGDVAAELRGDPELLGEPLTQLFRCEGDRELSFATIDKYAKGERSTWAEALLELAGTGELPRARLLQETLAALQRDFPAYRAMWFARLHEALAPTAAERGAHLGDYVRLVASRIAQVQSFGVRALAAAHRDGARLAFAQLDELEPAWTARQKGAVVTALRLAAGLAADADAAGRERVARAMARALAHGEGDVQAAAWQGLQRLDVPEALRRELVAPFVPTLAPRVRKLLGDVAQAAPAVTTQPFAAGAAAMPAGVVPIASFDELVRELSSLVVGADEPVVLERCLDGVLRFAGELPPDFARRTGGLRKLVRRDGGNRLQPFVRAWLEGRGLGAREGLLGPSTTIDLVAVLHPRLVEVLQLLPRAAGLPLLALPTRAPCWVEARVLQQRLACWDAAGVTPGEHDLAQALRRVPAAQRAGLARGLAPAGRPAAAVAFAPAPVLEARPAMAWRQTRDGVRYRMHTVALAGIAAKPAHPVVQLARRVRARRRLDGGGAWWADEFESPLLLRALAGLAPNDLEVLGALAAHRIGHNVDGGTVARGDLAFLEPLLWPEWTGGPHTHLLLAIALGARAPELHGIAVEVVLQALAGGRLDVAGLAAALRQLFAVRFVALSRWAKTLRTIAEAGPAAADVVFTLLEAVVAGPVDDVGHELGALLAVWADAAATTARRITGREALACLRQVAASGGRAARLARDLVARASD